MNKHAYLIMAHSQFDLLKKIIQALDFEGHDIYVHIDKKVKELPDTEAFYDCVSASVLYFTKKRINVQWGGFSQIRAELLLMKECCKKKYSYVHLISGADLPLKPAYKIYDFFENSGGKNFLDVSGSDNWSVEMTQWYTVFNENKYHSSLLASIREKFLWLQKKAHYQRSTYKQENIVKGSQWFSLTQNTIKYILENKKRIWKTFLFTYAPDEMFIPTILYGTEYYKLVSEKYHNMRYIEWDGKSRSPKIFTISDFEAIMSSEALFARKFSADIDSEIIERVLQTVIQNEDR